MDKLKCAVVGAGYFGHFHAQKYAQLSDCHLVAVVDSNRETCTAVADKTGAKAYTDYNDLIGLVDAASIATPTSTHYTIARALLDNGIHLLIEKPMTLSLKEADALIKIAERNKLTLQIGHVERFSPALLHIEPLVKQPEFIEVTRLTHYKQRSTNIGVILDLMIHDLDIVLSLANDEVASIHAKGVKVWSNEIDIANARLIFKNGCVANVTESRISLKSERKIRIFSYNGYGSVDMQHHTAKYHQISNRQTQQLDSDDYIPHQKPDPLRDEIVHFLHCVRSGETPKVSGAQGRSALALAQRVQKALEPTQ